MGDAGAAAVTVAVVLVDGIRAPDAVGPYEVPAGCRTTPASADRAAGAGAPAQPATRVLTALNTLVSVVSALWLMQAVLVLAAPSTGTELSGLMIVSHGDQYVA